MATKPVHHPIFARVYARLAKVMEPGQRGHRTELLEGLRGRVVEVGCGPGNNLAYYPAEVEQVLAVEPEAYLRGKAQHAARTAPVPVEVVAGSAEALPVEDGWADAVVFSLVLCSVPDPAVALAEATRVLKPGGLLCIYEHVVSADPKRRRYQERIDGTWTRFTGGCHCNRDTAAALAAAGYDLEGLRSLTLKEVPRVVPVEPHLLGQVRRA